MVDNKYVDKENNQEIKVMEVFYVTKDDKMHIDFFTEKEYIEVVEAFFLKGGLVLPPEIDDRKTISSLTEDDYKILFEELGYEVTGFSTYDPNVHQECHIPFNITSIKGNKDNKA